QAVGHLETPGVRIRLAGPQRRRQAADGQESANPESVHAKNSSVMGGAGSCEHLRSARPAKVALGEGIIPGTRPEKERLGSSTKGGADSGGWGRRRCCSAEQLSAHPGAELAEDVVDVRLAEHAQEGDQVRRSQTGKRQTVWQSLVAAPNEHL